MASVFGQVFGATTGGGGGALTLPTLPSSVYVGQTLTPTVYGGTAPYVVTVDGEALAGATWTPAAAGSYVLRAADAAGAETDPQTVTVAERDTYAAPGQLPKQGGLLTLRKGSTLSAARGTAVVWSSDDWGTLPDLTGYTVTLQAVRRDPRTYPPSAPTPPLTIGLTVSWTAPDDWALTLEATSAQTDTPAGDYDYEVDAEAGDDVEPLLHGVLRVLPDLVEAA
ncbi:hypothetical protein ACG2DA_14745, partial [Alienimonas sp. DA493]